MSRREQVFHGWGEPGAGPSLPEHAGAFLQAELGVSGDVVSLTGEVGLSRSFEPVESFVRFFLRNPRVGIGAAGRRERWNAGLP